MKSPDCVLEQVIETLCTESFDGIRAAELWDVVERNCTDNECVVDDFTRQVVNQWLLKDPRVLFGQLAEKSKVKTFAPINEQLSMSDILEKDLMIKVSDDTQSIYLTGLKCQDNALGRMPYDLLRIIAKYRTKGINSLDLIKESGQDKRSLTKRLSVLEENQYIVKMGVIIDKHPTNHMHHFRFIKTNTIIINDDTTNDDRYDRYLVITEIMNGFKNNTESPVRLTRDLFEELKLSQPGLNLRSFNGILRYLVVHGFVEMIQVEHGERKRFYSAIRHLKDLPESTSKTDLAAKIKEQQPDKDVNIDDDDGVSTQADDDELPQYSRFKPLVNQIRYFVQHHEESMISDIESHISSIYKSKPISNFIENLTCSNEKYAKKGTIMGKLSYSGKLKMYKLSTFEQWQRQNPDAKISKPASAKTFSNTPHEIPLFDLNGEYINKHIHERRLLVFEIIDVDNKFIKTYMLWKNKLKWGKQNLTSLFEGSMDDGIVKVDVTKKGPNAAINKEEYIRQLDLIDKYVNSSNKQNESFDVPEDDLPMETIIVKEKSYESTDVPVDNGPKRRTRFLLQEVDFKRCICINTDFCALISQKLGVDYTIDRRTLMRDSESLAKQGKLGTCRLGYEGQKFVIKSIKNPPTEDDLDEVIMDGSKTKSKTYRVFTDKVRLDNIVIFNEANLKRGLKFADKESRLKHASEMKSKSGIIGETGRIIHRRKRKKKSIQKEDVDDSDENSDYERGEGNNEEDDLFGPIMGKKKRKRFKPSSKSQARVARAFKKIRTSAKMKESDILIFIKSIIITQSLSQGSNIDWPKVAAVFENDTYSSETLRRLWPRYKKLLGVKNIMQAKKNWETVFLKAVEDKLVSPNDIINYKVEKMMELWTINSTEIFMSKSQMIIAKNYEENFKQRHFEHVKEDAAVDVYREPPSLIEKEQFWSTRIFAYPANKQNEANETYKAEALGPNPLQLAKIKLKALFATPMDKFNSQAVKKLFADIPREIYSKALSDLEDAKAIAFLGEDSSIKFTLTDKVMSVLECKLTPKFIEDSNQFQHLVADEVDTSHQGILLSTKCPVGAYAPLFNLMAQNSIRVTRIDQKPLELDSYSTKSKDRSQFEADFLISHFQSPPHSSIKQIKPVSKGPCSAIWVDLMNDINGDLFKRCICVIMFEILFHPGTKIGLLCRRVQPLLEPSEVKFIVDWLAERGCIVQNGDCYTATYQWYDLF